MLTIILSIIAAEIIIGEICVAKAKKKWNLNSNANSIAYESNLVS